MMQTRLCDFFEPRHKHVSRLPTTFLHLPESVRLRVYSYQADIPTTSAFDFRDKDGGFLLRGATAPISSFTNLRLVHPMVRDDVVKCLFSYYRINIWSGDLTKTALAAVWPLLRYARRLNIVLNLYGYTSAEAQWKGVKLNYKNPAFAADPDAWDASVVEHFLPTWKKMITKLESPQLELSLICDTTDERAARLILEPLARLRISKCSIRLNGKYDPQLESLARQAVLHITSDTPADRDPFRFLDLPAELRHHILSFTDLVAPFKEVQYCSIFHLEGRKGAMCPHPRDFCSRNGSVYPPCDCYRSPQPFFLVSRRMLQDARQVFYSSNRIVIKSPTCHPFSQPMGTRCERFEAAVFFGDIVPPEALGSLHDLEITFPPSQYNHLGMEPDVLADWEQAVQHAAGHMENLTLTLVFGLEDYPEWDPIHSQDIIASQIDIYKVYEQIVGPLQLLRGRLNKFFVNLHSPFRRSAADEERLDPVLDEQEISLERLVMGREYDAVLEGKADRKPSRWISQAGDLVGE